MSKKSRETKNDSKETWKGLIGEEKELEILSVKVTKEERKILENKDRLWTKKENIENYWKIEKIRKTKERFGRVGKNSRRA